MSTDRDTTRIVRSWLQTDEYESADRVLDAVLDRLDTTPQRRSTWWPARRLPQMNRATRFALASAAVVAVAVLGFTIFTGADVGAPDVTGPDTTSTPIPTAQALGDGPLDAGTYRTSPFPAPADTIRFSFTVPDGWVGNGNASITPTSGSEGPEGAALAFLQVIGLYSDPCQGNAGDPDIAVGPTVDDLASALADQPMYESTAPTDVIVDGYAGKRMDLTLPSDLDFASCSGGQYWVWDSAPYAQGPGNRWHLLILDVDGTRAVILAHDFATTPARIQGELQEIVDSIQIKGS